MWSDKIAAKNVKIVGLKAQLEAKDTTYVILKLDHDAYVKDNEVKNDNISKKKAHCPVQGRICHLKAANRNELQLKLSQSHPMATGNNRYTKKLEEDMLVLEEDMHKMSVSKTTSEESVRELLQQQSQYKNQISDLQGRSSRIEGVQI